MRETINILKRIVIVVMIAFIISILTGIIIWDVPEEVISYDVADAMTDTIVIPAMLITLTVLLGSVTVWLILDTIIEHKRKAEARQLLQEHIKRLKIIEDANTGSRAE